MSLPISEAGRRYGFKPSPVDHRDFGISSFARYLIADSAPGGIVNLERFCGSVRDQGSEGSCTAHAGVGLREFLARRYDEKAPVLSPAFLYWKEREMDGSLEQGDCGSYGRTAVKVLNQFGCCALGDEPYVAGDVSTAPTDAQVAEALSWKGGAYHALGNVADMRSCLGSGYVFCLGFTVYESFETSDLASSGRMPIPDVSTERILGGHEVLAIGYDDAEEALIIRNSWSSNWGIGGNFYMPYVVAANPQVVSEAWIAHLGKAWG